MIYGTTVCKFPLSLFFFFNGHDAYDFDGFTSYTVVYELILLKNHQRHSRNCSMISTIVSLL